MYSFCVFSYLPVVKSTEILSVSRYTCHAGLDRPATSKLKCHSYFLSPPVPTTSNITNHNALIH